MHLTTGRSQLSLIQDIKIEKSEYTNYNLKKNPTSK